MKCYLTLIHASDWEERLGEVSPLLSSHGLRRTDLSFGESLTYESTKNTVEAEILVRHFLVWLDSVVASSDRGVPPWSILVTNRRLASERSPRDLPRWALAEFFNSVLLEEEALARLAHVDPNLAHHFELNRDLQLYVYKWTPRQGQRHERADGEEPTEVAFEDFSNDPGSEPQKTTVSAKGFQHLVSLAKSAYRGLRIDSSRGLGGVNALVLLSGELNHLRRGTEPEGPFALFNLSALRLRYSADPDSLANSVTSGKLEVLQITAEPGNKDEEEEGDGFSSSR